MPDCPLATTTGGTLSLGALPGLAVVAVYPWTGRAGLANPPGWDDIAGAHGSTQELEGFRHVYDWFAGHGISVVALSAQDSGHQAELVARLGLPFPVVSDSDGIATDAANLPAFEIGGMRYLKRLTLVLWRGRVVRCFYPVHPPHTHAAEVQAWLRGEMGFR